MKFNYISICFFFLISCHCWSQSNIKFDLDTYRQVNFQRQSFVFTPNFRLNAEDEINVEDADVEYEYRLAGTGAFSEEVNNTNDQTSVNFRTSYKNDDRSIDSEILYSLTKRTYNINTSTDNSFVKYGVSISGRLDKEKLANTTRRVSARTSFGIGNGRVEFVNHAWLAVQILQSLETEGELLFIPDEARIAELADKIGELLNERYYDYRLRTLSVLEKLVFYMGTKGMIDSSSPKATLIISDNYSYELFFNRYTGRRIEWVAGQRMYINRSNNQVGQSIVGDLNLGMQFVDYKNVDLSWMREISLFLAVNNSYSYGMSRSLDRVFSSFLYVQLDCEWNYMYLYDVRNNVEFSNRISLRQFVDKGELFENRINNSDVFLTSSLTYNRYLSPRTQFVMLASLSVSEYSSFEQFFQPTIWGFVSFSLNHAIF